MRLGRRELRARRRDRCLFAVDLPGKLLRDLRLVRRCRRELAFQLDHVGLGLLQRESVAGTGRNQLPVLPDPQPRELKPRP